MATISGIFNDPFGKPLARVVIELTARKTTSVTFTGTNAAAVTAEDGSYSMSVLPGVYAVTANIQSAPDYMGIIQVYADSPDASLNQYLAAFNPDDVTPLVLAEMQAILLATLAAAKAAEESAEKAASYALKFLGPYDAAIAYEINDVVLCDGSQYKALDITQGTPPPGAPWELYVERGEPGPANILTVDTVTTLEAGSLATVEIIGNTPSQIVNFGIPKGDPGKDAPPQLIPKPGELGSTVLASLSVSGSAWEIGTGYRHIGQTVSGSLISPCCLSRDATKATNWTQITLDVSEGNFNGTWACAGYVVYGLSATLWTRIV